MSALRPSAPKAVRWIARTLDEAGYDTWAVGGAVRDMLLGRPSGDWDLATRARPEQVRQAFRRTVPIGLEHGTVGVLARDGTMYEVTTFRRDVETDGRHAVVSFANTIEEDLSRRDFTVNAVAWHPLREELLDPFQGLADLEHRVLRTVGQAAERFREDHLRILRAFRFAGLFDLEIHEDTWSSLCELVDDLTTLSAERVRDELMKLLAADPMPARALDLYARSGALGVLYPELDVLRVSTGAGPALDAWTISVATVCELPAGRPMVRLAALLRPMGGRDAAALLTRLRFSNAAVDETVHRAGAASLPPSDAGGEAFRRWLSSIGPDRLAGVARLDLARALAECRRGLEDRVAAVVTSWRQAKAVLSTDPPLVVGDLVLDGRGLISLGLRPGPGFGLILDGLLDWVLEDPTRNRRELLEKHALALASTHAPDD